MTDDRPIVAWTAHMLGRFKDAFNQAAEDEQDSFVFDGVEFYTPYAAYLIEYLDTVFTPDSIH